MITQPTIKIDLAYPLSTPNGVVHAITLRRAKVSDVKAVQGMDMNAADQELALVARLAQEKLTTEDIEEMDLADFAKVQEVFRGLVGKAG